MNAISKSLLVLALGFGTAAAGTPVQEQGRIVQIKGQVVTHYVLNPGTPEFEQARVFLAEASSRQTQARLAAVPPTVTAGATGDMYITVTHQVADTSSGYEAASAPQPPARPWQPGGVDAAEGDTASIATCGGGSEQQWELRYEPVGPNAYGWVTVSYSYAKKTMCSPSWA